MKLPLPCIVCGYEPETAGPPLNDDEPYNQPYSATAFHSEGHYGSTVWDPMTGQWIEINVCDACLVKAGDKGQVIVYDLMPNAPESRRHDFQLWTREYDSRGDHGVV